MTAPFDLLGTPLPPGTTLLEASAGTGKTYALAAIYLRLVAEEGLAVSQIAVTTYTIPATEELRQRIRTRLVEAVQVFDGASAQTPFIAELVRRHAGDQIIRQRLADAVRDFDEACISTIHGFCQRLLRERSFESGAPPEAELLPDQSSLVREITEDFWRRHFSAVRTIAAPLALLTKLTPAHLAELWQNAARQPTAQLVPDPTTASTILTEIEALLAEFQAQWPAWRVAVQRHFIDDTSWAKAIWKKTEENRARLQLVDHLATNLLAPLSCYTALQHFLPSVVTEKGVRAKHQLPAYAFGPWCERFVAATDAFAATTRAQFLAWARPELAQCKVARGVMSFDDLLSRLHDALHGPSADALIAAVRARFRASLVDEFQDTDPIQEAIFRRLFADDPEHRLFFIGDPKQAIYAFRGADLHTYLAARRRAARVFLLDTNHRSDAFLVQAVNTLFLRPPAPFLEPIEYPEAKAHRDPFDRQYLVDGQPRPPLRFAFWEGEEPITITRADRELPAAIATGVAQLLATATLKGQPLRPCDIAVLCTANAQCQAVQAALTARQIPAVVLTNASVFRSTESREMLILLTALARPSYEPAVRAALATSLFGLDAAALVALAENTLAWEQRLALFTDGHTRWRDRGFIQMFRQLLRDTHARPHMLTLSDGERRLTNFLHLAELLHGAAREFSLDQGGVLRWLTTMLDDPSSGDEYEVRLESDDDAVKVVTIHKSKGLEWPVVFCPFLWTKTKAGKDAWTVYHDERGRPVLDLGSNASEAARETALEERLAENLRLLYVALTRARHECHVVWGLFNESETSAMMWLLENPDRPGFPPTSRPAARLAAHVHTLDAPHLRATLQYLATTAPDHISVEPFQFAPPSFLSRPSSSVLPSIAARTFTTALDRTWRVSSFSSLTVGAESDHDRDYDDRPRLDASQLRGIHAFPRSNRAGICIHEIFEELDFTAPSTLAPLVADKLRLHGMFSPENAASLTQCVRQTLAAPLGPTTLDAIPTPRTLRELEFHLPARLLTPAQITAAAGTGLHFEPRRGILTGYIDLIFEHAGRYSIVDWKSNHLGATEDAYDAATIGSTMERHHYHLQWRLYVLALHRFLQSRRPDYSPEQHLGGVFYLFLRGITPGRPELGIFHAAPDPTEIAALEKTFLP